MKLLTCSLLAALAACVGCRDLDRFDTRGEAAYCGDLVSGPAFHDGFVASGQPPSLRLKLTLDIGQVSSYSEGKTTLLGHVTSNDEKRGLCADEGKALFESAPLRAIPQLYHDSVSTLSFGEGHDDDFFAWADSTCQGTMLVLVSLLRSGEVEARLFKPAPLPALDAGPAQRPGFALFHLQRHDEGCEF